MEWIKNLKISNKLMILMTISLFFVVVVGIVGFVFTGKSNKAIKQLYTQNLKTISMLGSIRGNYEQGIADVLYLYDDISLAQKKHWHEDLKELRSKNGELLRAYKDSNISAYEKERIEQILEKSKVFWANMYTSIEHADRGDTAGASRIFNANLHYILEERTLLQELIKYNEDAAEAVDSQNNKNSATANTILTMTILVSFVLLIVLNLMISNMVTRPIKRAIDGLSMGTDEVSSAASQVASASQQLAEGTSEQAASVQETSSTLEETSSMVHQNRENTQQAATLAKQAKQYAEQSNTEMGKMSISMNELKSSSNEISKIIKVIDEIAFQTNILSLNAAVEAARAGDAGKGFAVVAEEVRNLAQRSAQAAKDTTIIIESNIELSDTGVEIAKKVRDSVESIGDQAAKVSDLLDEISVATNEQAQGVEQINKAVSQMEIVLSANAQTAEEAASASCALSEQAVNVKEIVDSLVALVDGADAVHSHTRSQPVLQGTGSRYIAPAKSEHRSQSSSARGKIGNTPKLQIDSKVQSPEDIFPLNDF